MPRIRFFGAFALASALVLTSPMKADEQPRIEAAQPDGAAGSPNDRLQELVAAAKQFKAAGQIAEFRAKYSEADALYQSETARLAKQQEDLQGMMSEVHPPQVKMEVVIAEATNLDPAILNRMARFISGGPSVNGSSPDIELYHPNDGAALIRVLEQNRQTQILSRPTVLAIDGQTAEIQIGGVVPRPTSMNVESGVPKPKFTDEFVGISVSVVPTITSPGRLALDLTALRSELSGSKAPLFASSKGKDVVLTPIIDTSRMQTTLKSNNGQTTLVALRSTPKSGSKAKSKTTLIMLTPVIEAAFAAEE